MKTLNKIICPIFASVLMLGCRKVDYQIQTSPRQQTQTIEENLYIKEIKEENELLRRQIRCYQELMKSDKSLALQYQKEIEVRNELIGKNNLEIGKRQVENLK